MKTFPIKRPAYAAFAGFWLLAAQALGFASAQESDIGAFSAKPADPPPPAPTYKAVYVRKNPTAGNEAKTIKDAYQKLKSGGAIYLTEMSTDISNDEGGFVVTRPFHLALDSGLMGEIDKRSKDAGEKAAVNPAQDGSCITVDLTSVETAAGGRGDPGEITIRDVEFTARPDIAATCITLVNGKLMLDNVGVKSNFDGDAFERGVLVTGGELATLRSFSIEAARSGMDIRGGLVSLPDGGTITRTGAGDPARGSVDEACRTGRFGDHAFGLIVERGSDMRKADPAIAASGLLIRGFDAGICAIGSGLRISRSELDRNFIGAALHGAAVIDGMRIKNSGDVGVLTAGGANKHITDSVITGNPVGALLDGEIVLSGSRIEESATAGILNRSANATVTDNEVVNNRVGVDLDGGTPQDFSGNIVAFNLAAFAGAGDDEDIGNVRGNIVSCNAEIGSVGEARSFRRFNIRKKNKEKFCTGARRSDHCDELRPRGPAYCGDSAALNGN
ncbi:right-handed parallel beta-helix repeat-containing protein [Hyphococcus sp.]|uniref:right-handed parallel beta-helix repeat-containing protein n=1 Tax=Hyphococcus sp. TaxID=2038636 RepID=UPI0035C67E6B